MNTARFSSARKLRRALYAVGFASACSVFGVLGCRSGRATADDCARILDKIVELELHERGFRDPVLLQRKRDELRRRLGSELDECEGKSMRAGAIGCVEHATTTEEISHQCLR
ncbi:MAG TPA: hypothetical protein VHC69_20990 [Polyangiaceae bacterium]|nr:hypothetical protein [Polyangiaceae bacterium]